MKLRPFVYRIPEQAVRNARRRKVNAYKTDLAGLIVQESLGSSQPVIVHESSGAILVQSGDMTKTKAVLTKLSAIPIDWTDGSAQGIYRQVASLTPQQAKAFYEACGFRQEKSYRRANLTRARKHNSAVRAWHKEATKRTK